MRHEIILAPQAIESLKKLSAFWRATVTNAIETHLRHRPTVVSKSRIKRLRGLTRPQYRLRVNDIRVFYDVADEEVQILAIVTKEEAERWLQARGETERKP